MALPPHTSSFFHLHGPGEYNADIFDIFIFDGYVFALFI